MVDYQYSKKFKLVAMGRPIEQVKMRMEQEGLDPSVLDLDMNTVGFLNIPEGEEVKYPDGHVEPCCKPGTAPAPTPVAAVAFSASASSVTRKPAARQSMVKPKEETLAPRPKYKHEAKLRPLYWDVLTSKSVVEKSMWFQMNDRDIKLDTAMLDTEFTSKPMTFVLPVAEETKTSDVVNLLDPKREQNVGIAIGRLKVSTQQLHHALLFGDFSVITRENISQLVNAAPTEDEQAACLAFSGDEKKLSSASRFAYELSDIPMVAVRFECCKTIITFDDEVTRIRKIIQVYEANEKMMMNSTGIKQLMKLILAIGNYLNGESARGGAWGFKINLLSKLSQTKTADGQMLRRLYGLDPAEYAGCALYYPAGDMGVTELLLLRVQTDDQLETVQAAAQQRLDTQTNTFAGYAPEQYALCKDGSAIVIKGQDVMFVISADKDAAVRAFRAVHSGRAGA